MKAGPGAALDGRPPCCHGMVCEVTGGRAVPAVSWIFACIPRGSAMSQLALTTRLRFIYLPLTRCSQQAKEK